MPYQILSGAKQPIKVWVDDLKKVESGALDQLRESANLPWVKGVAAMPDLHVGKGSTVGSVILNEGAVSPSVVGVDQGCGMCAVKTPLKVGQLGKPYALRELRDEIEKVVPVGFNWNTKVSARVKKAFDDIGPQSELGTKFMVKAIEQLGSLGGGNHFIEICVTDADVWVMLHSGSRNIGKELAEEHMRRATGLLAETVRTFGEICVPKILAPLLRGTPAYQDYVSDLLWCQRYARANRDEMMLRVLKVVSEHVFGEDRGPAWMTQFRVDCHHNYIEEVEVDGNHCLLTRKGAVSAKAGEWGIIPGSMGTKSFIVKGKGNAESFHSCSHGAGRKMSRGAAKAKYTLKDLENQLKGVECRLDKSVIDEIPSAYKNIDVVMANQEDLVEAVYTLKQIVCVKG